MLRQLRFREAPHPALDRPADATSVSTIAAITEERRRQFPRDAIRVVWQRTPRRIHRPRTVFLNAGANNSVTELFLERDSRLPHFSTVPEHRFRIQRPRRGRTKREDARIGAVGPKRPMTPEQFAKRRREYSILHDSMVKPKYRRAWKDCAMDGEDIPAPSDSESCAGVESVVAVGGGVDAC